MADRKIDFVYYIKWLTLYLSLAANLHFILRNIVPRYSGPLFESEQGSIFSYPRQQNAEVLDESNVTPSGFVCTVGQTLWQADYLKTFLEKENGYGCAEPVNFLPFLKPIWKLEGKKIVFVNIGANKGYEISEWLAVMAQKMGISPKIWGIDHMSVKYKDIFDEKRLCGVCSSCNKKIALIHNFTSSLEPEDLVVIGAEPMPSNFKLLQELKKVLSFPGLVLLPCAIGEEPGSGFFPDMQIGDEVQSLKLSKENENQIPVNVTSVDEIASAFSVNRIHYLKIDTEGYDPKVIRGSKASLRKGTVSVLEFEFNGMWTADESLQNTVNFLDGFGYDCYLKTRERLLRITGCYDPIFDRRLWASPNVICSSRRDIAVSAYFLSHSMLEWS